MENQLAQVTALAGSCGSVFTENFNSYVSGYFGLPLDGVTKAGSIFGFGYCAVMTRNRPALNYGISTRDHTGGMRLFIM